MRPTRSSRTVCRPQAIAGVPTRPAHTAAAGGRVAYIRRRCGAAHVEGQVFLAGVDHGAPADRAGLLVGDEIVAADSAPFDPIGSFADLQQRSTMTAPDPMRLPSATSAGAARR